MRNPLTLVKRAFVKTFDYPAVTAYVLGAATGVCYVLIVQAGLPATVIALTKENAQFLLDNPEKVVYFQRALRDVVVTVAT